MLIVACFLMMLTPIGGLEVTASAKRLVVRRDQHPTSALRCLSYEIVQRMRPVGKDRSRIEGEI